MDRRAFIGTAGAAAAAFGTSSFMSKALAQQQPETAKLAFGFGRDPVFAPHMVAMEKGWLKEAGFTEVTTKTFAGGALAGEALVAGEIALWTPGNLPPVSMAHSGVPIVLLGNNATAMAAENLVARKDAKIRAPEDLYRIRIGLMQGSTASADLANLARHYKLDEKKLQVVNMPPPEQLAGLKSNNIQALLCWQPWGYNALQTGETELIHSGTVSHFEKNRGEKVQISYTRSVFVASQAFVRKNPIATAKMMAALTRAQQYVADPSNRTEVIDLFCEQTKQDKTLATAIWDDFVFDPSIDQAYVDDMKAMTDYLVTSGRVKNPKDPLDYTFSEPVGAVDPALVKVAGRFKV